MKIKDLMKKLEAFNPELNVVINCEDEILLPMDFPIEVREMLLSSRKLFDEEYLEYVPLEWKTYVGYENFKSEKILVIG